VPVKVFDPRKHAFRQKREEKVHPQQLQKDKEAAGPALDEALADSFPASDPPAAVTPKKRKAPK
jgi:hypothetical protein